MAAVAGHAEIVVLRAQFHGRHILQPHHRIVLLAHDELPETIQRMQIGGRPSDPRETIWPLVLPTAVR